MRIGSERSSQVLFRTTETLLSLSSGCKTVLKARKQDLRPRAPRVHVNWTVRAKGGSVGWLCGRILNISESGLLFVSPSKFPTGHSVAVTIEVSPTCRLHCRVENVRANRALGGVTVYGGRFIWWSGNDFEILRREIELARSAHQRMRRHSHATPL